MYEYISSQEFIRDLKNDQGYTIITDRIIWENTKNVTRYNFSDLFEKGKKISENTIMICIAYWMTAKDMLILKNILPNNHHRVSMNPWVTSLREKNMPEENDIIHMLSKQYNVVEPYGYNHFQHIIWWNIPSYSRIFDVPLPELLSTTWKVSESSIFISGSEISSELTIVTTPSCVDKVASAIHSYTQWSSDIFDLYVSHHFSNSLDQSIIESIKKTQRALFIIDHKATEEMCLFLERLVQKKCWKEIYIHYLFPQHHIVESILSDYNEEESLFDKDSIENFISSILEEK